MRWPLPPCPAQPPPLPPGASPAQPCCPCTRCSQAIGHPEQALLITHRLDQCTEGLLVLGKTKEFVRQFNEVIKQGSNSGSSGDGSGGGRGSGNGAGSESDGAGGAAQNRGSGGGVAGRAAAARPLRKFYRAATAAAPPLGLLRHRLSIERRQQGLPSFTVAHEWEEEVEGSLPAELRVLEVAPIRCVCSIACGLGWGQALGQLAGPCASCLHLGVWEGCFRAALRPNFPLPDVVCTPHL